MIKKILLILLEIFLVANFIWLITLGNKKLLLPFVLYQFIIIIVINAHFIKNFKFSKFFRRSLYYIPHIISIFLISFEKPDYGEIGILVWLLISIGIGLVLSIPKLFTSRYLFNREMVLFLPSLSIKEYLFDLYSYIMAPPFQEIFYKAFLLYIILKVYPYPIALLILGILFVSEHYFHFASNKFFSSLDYIIQFIFSIISGYIFILTKSLLLCIVIHLIYNFIALLTPSYRLIIQKFYSNTNKKSLV